MKPALLLTCAAMIFALAVHLLATIAPGMAPDVAQQQRVTAPWLSGERR